MQIKKKSIFQSRKNIEFNFGFFKNFRQESFGLIHRLFVQAIRRPSHIISGLIQPLLWLILFGSLFKNVPLNLFNIDYGYTQFLSAGIITFTCFTGSLNAGLPLIFDREFGFLNRLLVSPLRSKNAIVVTSILFIVCITMMQNCIIIMFSLKSIASQLSFYKLQLIIYLNTLLTIIISSISLTLAFILPGHIEFLACTLILNLPTLFTSTALAPIYLMPYWLQVVSKLNILTYVIESLRFITINEALDISVLEIFGQNLDVIHIFILLISLNILSLTIVTNIVNNKLE